MARRACWWIVQSKVRGPLKYSRETTSPVPAPPAWGPAAVAAVPAKIVTAPSGSSPRTAHTEARSVRTGRSPGS